VSHCLRFGVYINANLSHCLRFGVRIFRLYFPLSASEYFILLLSPYLRCRVCINANLSLYLCFGVRISACVSLFSIVCMYFWLFRLPVCEQSIVFCHCVSLFALHIMNFHHRVSIFVFQNIDVRHCVYKLALQSISFYLCISLFRVCILATVSLCLRFRIWFLQLYFPVCSSEYVFTPLYLQVCASEYVFSLLCLHYLRVFLKNYVYFSNLNTRCRRHIIRRGSIADSYALPVNFILRNKIWNFKKIYNFSDILTL